jgi:hypothetical protein
LESRWNNLSTRELCERIIGQIEQLHTPSKVANDIEFLNGEAQATKMKLAHQDTSINSIKQELAEVKTVAEEVKRVEEARRAEKAQRVRDHSVGVQEAPEQDNGTPAKKRKLREHANLDQYSKRANVRFPNGH